MKNARKSVILLALLALFLAPKAYAGFGVSPSRIIVDNLIKGSSLDRVVYFVQGTPDADLKVKIDVDDSKVKNWIKVEPSGDFVIPKGVQQFPVTVHIDVPQDAQLGIYTAFVRAVGAPADNTKKEGNNVTIAIGAQAEFDLTVGEGIQYQYAIRNIDIKNINDSENPVADVAIENQGNVPAGPTEASFELFNKYGDIRLAYVQGVKVAPVKAFTVENRTIEFPISINLSVGEYWGTVKLYNEKGESVREFKGVFNVSKSTFMDKYGRYITYAALGLGVLFVLLIVTIFLRRKRR